MDLHVFPFPIPPPTSLPIPSLWVFPVHQPWALVSWIFQVTTKVSQSGRPLEYLTHFSFFPMLVIVLLFSVLLEVFTFSSVFLGMAVWF